MKLLSTLLTVCFCQVLLGVFEVYAQPQYRVTVDAPAFEVLSSIPADIPRGTAIVTLCFREVFSRNMNSSYCPLGVHQEFLVNAVDTPPEELALGDGADTIPGPFSTVMIGGEIRFQGVNLLVTVRGDVNSDVLDTVVFSTYVGFNQMNGAPGTVIVTPGTAIAGIIFVVRFVVNCVPGFIGPDCNTPGTEGPLTTTAALTVTVPPTITVPPVPPTTPAPLGTPAPPTSTLAPSTEQTTIVEGTTSSEPVGTMDLASTSMGEDQTTMTPPPDPEVSTTTDEVGAENAESTVPVAAGVGVGVAVLLLLIIVFVIVLLVWKKKKGSGRYKGGSNLTATNGNAEHGGGSNSDGGVHLYSVVNANKKNKKRPVLSPECLEESLYDSFTSTSIGGETLQDPTDDTPYSPENTYNTIPQSLQPSGDEEDTYNQLSRNTDRKEDKFKASNNTQVADKDGPPAYSSLGELPAYDVVEKSESPVAKGNKNSPYYRQKNPTDDVYSQVDPGTKQHSPQPGNPGEKHQYSQVDYNAKQQNRHSLPDQIDNPGVRHEYSQVDYDAKRQKHQPPENLGEHQYSQVDLNTKRQKNHTLPVPTQDSFGQHQYSQVDLDAKHRNRNPEDQYSEVDFGTKQRSLHSPSSSSSTAQDSTVYYNTRPQDSAVYYNTRDPGNKQEPQGVVYADVSTGSAGSRVRKSGPDNSKPVTYSGINFNLQAN